MRASQGLCRLARAVYYNTTEVDQLSPFLESCIREPKLADHVREIYISEQNFPLATLAVVSCIKLEKLAVEGIVNIEYVLPVVLVGGCATLFRSNKSATSRFPLSNLRTLAIQAPSHPDEYLLPKPQRNYQNWVELVTHLPKIDSIEIFDGFLPKGVGKSLTSNLKSLTVTSLRFACDEENIRHFLGICPFLESFDLTTRPEVLRDEESSSWSAIGEMLRRNGANLRKFRYDRLSRPSAPGLLNVSSLRNLRYLAVPVEALMPLHDYQSGHFGDYSALFKGNRHGFGSVYDVEDMWRGDIAYESDAARRDGSETAGKVDEDDRTRSMLDRGPDVPFSHLFPDTLQHLRIMDDVDTDSVASYVDERLRGLVLAPRFSGLQDVRVRRRNFFTQHVRDIGWHIERCPFWNVMRRV